MIADSDLGGQDDAARECSGNLRADIVEARNLHAKPVLARQVVLYPIRLRNTEQVFADH